MRLLKLISTGEVLATLEKDYNFTFEPERIRLKQCI